MTWNDLLVSSAVAQEPVKLPFLVRGGDRRCGGLEFHSACDGCNESIRRSAILLPLIHPRSYPGSLYHNLRLLDSTRWCIYRLCVGGFVTSTSIDVSQFLNFGLRLVFPGNALPEYLNFSVVIRTLCKHLVVDSPFQRLAADLELQPDFRPFQPSKTSGLCFLERFVLYY